MLYVIPFHYYVNSKSYSCLVESLLKELSVDLVFTKGNTKHYDRTLVTFLYNFSRCSLGSVLKFTIAAPFFSGGIINGKKVKVPVSRTYFKRVLNWLEDKEYIEVYIGGKFYYTDQGVSKRDSSEITVLPKMYDLLAGKQEKHIITNVCILRDKDKKDMAYELTPFQQRMVIIMDVYNEFISDHEFLDGNGVVLPEPYLRRVFNEDFYHGGRFYTQGAVIQGLSEKDRANITIDGSNVCEIDVKNIHPAILYTEKGLVMDVDPYDFHVPCNVDQDEVEKHKKEHGLDKYDPVRNFAKFAVLATLNCKNYQAALGAMREEVRKDNKRKPYKKRYVGVDAFSFDVVVENMKEHNIGILNDFHSGVGSRLQYADSVFMEKVLTLAVQSRVVVSPIHDSVLCKVEDKSRVVGYMTRAFEETFGSLDNFKLTVG